LAAASRTLPAPGHRSASLPAIVLARMRFGWRVSQP